MRCHTAYPGMRHNRGEQEMRNPVLARKVCQQNRSAAGAETHALLLSLFRTAELQGHEPLAFLRQLTEAAIAGQPLELIRPGTRSPGRLSHTPDLQYLP